MKKTTVNCPKCKLELVVSSPTLEVRCPDCSEVLAMPQSGRPEETREFDASATADFAPPPGDANQATLTFDSQSPTKTDASHGLRKIGRFEIRRWLGEGAFGAVFEAYDPQLDRAVAIKVAKLGRGDAEQRIKRFLREAKARERAASATE